MEVYHPAIPPRYQIAAFQHGRSLKKVPPDVMFLAIDLEAVRKEVERVCLEHNLLQSLGWDMFFGTTASNLGGGRAVLFIDRMYLSVECDESVPH